VKGWSQLDVSSAVKIRNQTNNQDQSNLMNLIKPKCEIVSGPWPLAAFRPKHLLVRVIAFRPQTCVKNVTKPIRGLFSAAVFAAVEGPRNCLT
jgi:hypothetical protein